MFSDNRIAVQILKKMIYHGYIGGKHTSEENICRGFPSHAKKNVKKILKELQNKSFVLCKPTGYGKQFFINPRTVYEIKQIILSNEYT